MSLQIGEKAPVFEGKDQNGQLISLANLKGKKVETESDAVISFNFPMDKKFSACPTTSSLKKVIGEEAYNNMQLLNTGYKDEKGKNQLSVEDVWHCLQMDTFGAKDKKEVRTEFAKKHLKLDEKALENFVKIKLVKGYGSLSKSAIKKIIPYKISKKVKSILVAYVLVPCDFYNCMSYSIPICIIFV